MPEDVRPRIYKALSGQGGHAGAILYGLVERRYKQALETTRACLRKNEPAAAAMDKLTIDELQERHSALAKPSTQLNKMFTGRVDVLDDVVCEAFGSADPSQNQLLETAITR